jgi:polar amino acid transport system substrate-binding protein
MKLTIPILWMVLGLILNGPALSKDLPEDVDRIKKRGHLVVAMVESNAPPFFFHDENGELKGLDVRLAEGIAEHLGVNVEYNRDAETFNNVVDLVADRKADVAISKLSRTLARAQRVRFTKPYIVLRQGLMVNRLELEKVRRKGETDTAAIKSMRGPIGVIANSSYVSYAASRFPNAAIRQYDNWNEVVEAVLAGEVLAAYRDELEVKKIIKERPNAAIELQTVVLTDTRDPIAMVVHHQDTHLLAWLEIYLDTLNLDFTADSLLEEYPEIFQ